MIIDVFNEAVELSDNILENIEINSSRDLVVCYITFIRILMSLSSSVDTKLSYEIASDLATKLLNSLCGYSVNEGLYILSLAMLGWLKYATNTLDTTLKQRGDRDEK